MIAAVYRHIAVYDTHMQTDNKRHGDDKECIEEAATRYDTRIFKVYSKTGK